MFIVVRGVQVGMIDHWSFSIPDDPTQALLIGAGVSAIGSNVVNNVPMTLLMMSLFPRVSGAAQEALAYGTLAGSNIGPTLITYGSLATILWLNILRRRDLEV